MRKFKWGRAAKKGSKMHHARIGAGVALHHEQKRKSVAKQLKNMNRTKGPARKKVGPAIHPMLRGRTRK